MIDNSLTQNKESQDQISPEDAINLLKEGNERFISKQPLSRDLNQQVSETAKGQWPFAAVLSCIDSRVPAETVFDQGIGDIFSARVAGNFVNIDILGSIEYACKVAGSKAVVVLGHTGCGAVKGACDNVELGNITDMLRKLKPAVDGVDDETEDRSSANTEFVNKVVELNVLLTVDNMKSQSPVLNEMVQNGEIIIAGAVYDVSNGQVTFL